VTISINKLKDEVYCESRANTLKNHKETHLMHLNEKYF